MLIRDTAVHLAHHAWIERRLYEVVGAWAATSSDGEVAGLLAATAQHHAWHASLLGERVPVVHDLDPAELEPAPGRAAYLDAVAASADDVERLVALGQVVLPDLLRGYRTMLDDADPVTDAPVARALRLVVLDEQEDRQAAEVVLRSRLRDEDHVVRAAAHRSALERLLLS